ncbi:MAG: hypothetical protein AAFZ52_16135, partial [Bacteroidota bacterium]
MAHLLKLPQRDQKGVLLFTHKEIAHFKKAKKQIRFDRVNQVTNRFFPLNELSTYYAQRFAELRKHY